MRLLDLTLATPEENIALDEALVMAADSEPRVEETLRIWEAPSPLVVVGRSSSVGTEVDHAACEADAVPIIRRTSGGAAIVAGPGCLMYALVLSYDRRPDLRLIDRAHRFVLDRIANALNDLAPGLRQAGTSDLAIENQKVSGNSMRCCRRHMLYHGTLLYDMPMGLIERYLRTPPREPDYREARSHTEFVANLSISRDDIFSRIVEGWQAVAASSAWPQKLTTDLVQEKYACDAWNKRID
jgi:lipoate-protein ligase A